MHLTRRTLLTALGTGAVAATSGCSSFLENRRAWQFSTNGAYVPFPVAADGRVYVGATGGPFRVLDADEGDVRWTFDAAKPCPTQPVVGAEHVFVGDRIGWLYALPKGGGSERWKTRLPKVAFLPTLTEDAVVVGGNQDHGVYPVAVADGRIDDGFAGVTDIASGPVIQGDSVYVGDRSGGVTAFDRATGAVRWQRAFDDEIGFGMAFSEETLYVTSNHTVYGLDASDGGERWHVTTGDVATLSTEVVDGTVYVGSVDGHLYALAAGDGTERWRFEAGDALGHSTVFDDTVYVGDYSGTFYAIDAVDGTERWRTEVGGQTSTRPAVDAERVYVGDETGLLALER